MNRLFTLILCGLGSLLLTTMCQQRVATEVIADASLTGGGSSHQSERRKFLFPPFPPADAKVSGEFLKAFLAAMESFKVDPQIPDGKRKIENYDIEFRQGQSSYYIYFIPRKMPFEIPAGGGESALGKWVTYEIRKTDFQITARQFYK